MISYKFAILPLMNIVPKQLKNFNLHSALVERTMVRVKMIIYSSILMSVEQSSEKILTEVLLVLLYHPLRV